ncbi:hypothetical protein B0A48_03410 [Cryoendolithus antarcticus]|uniref:Uncharacterized protein n=1 Tax=Cryoendolithus antarcticus TaxID=1507870 RepID=A0A1V8TJX4_9PEZI|nr:hypothetical protein B0A48_03410 [Cryoendolithus antarcticus]
MVAEVTGPEMGPSKGAVSTNRVTQLMSKEARLLQRDDGLTQREAEVMRKKAELTDREAKLVRDQAELMRRSEVIGAGLLLSAEVIQPLRSTQQEIRDLDAGHEEALLAHGAEIAVLQRRVQVARARCEATVRRYEGAKMGGALEMILGKRDEIDV